MPVLGGLLVSAVTVAVMSVISYQFGTPPDTGHGVKLGSGKMFDKVAPRYDLVNSALTMKRDAAWRDKMIDALRLKSGDRVLDVGTGTAEVALAIASHLGSKGQGGKMGKSRVLGVDPSEGMISIGRDKVAKAGLDKSVSLVIGDAEDLSSSVPEGTKFDGATMAFVIRNVPDRAKAMAQIADRLKGGARLAVLELGFPEFPPAKWFVRHCVPFIGWLLSRGNLKKEYTYLNDSMRRFKLDDIEGLMRQAGLTLVRKEKMNFGSVGLYVGEKAADPEPASQQEGARREGAGEAEGGGAGAAPSAA
mmetsp:Transcript_26483/g.66820  ORF Transcript_26483/g.66820 Transcript_26483/m.66820 type:complete len:305 (+) Transcript_26483:167-1081(+)